MDATRIRRTRDSGAAGMVRVASTVAARATRVGFPTLDRPGESPRPEARSVSSSAVSSARRHPPRIRYGPQAPIGCPAARSITSDPSRRVRSRPRSFR